MNVDASPDGETLVFDLLGDIYQLPMRGGKASQLTAGRAWDYGPLFSGDGKAVFFVSDRKGSKGIWRLTLADGSLQQITNLESDVLGAPNWLQAGRGLLAGIGDHETFNTEVILHEIDPETGSAVPIDAPSEPWLDLDTFERRRSSIKIYSGVESSDGNVIYSRSIVDPESGRPSSRVYKFNGTTQTRTALTSPNASYGDYKPQISHNGKWLTYFRQHKDRRTEIRILNRTTGKEETLVKLSNADDAIYSFWDDSRPNYSFTHDDQKLIFWHAGRIRRVDVSDGSMDIIPFHVTVVRDVWTRAVPSARHIDGKFEARVIRWPSVSRDGETMVFAAVGFIWVMDLATHATRRLTRSSDFEYMPSISPDGRSVAYVRFEEQQSEYWLARLMVANVDNGFTHIVLEDPKATYLLPKWSQDGQKIALIREVKGVRGTEAAFGWTPRTGGLFHEVASAPASDDRLSFYIYARFVGFDTTDRNLLFSYPRSRNEVVLASVALDGGAQTTLALGTSEVGGITPAPNLKSLALTKDDGTVWVVPFEAGEEQSRVSTLSSEAHRVSNGDGYYVDWNQPNRLTFAFGQEFYRFALGDKNPEVLRVKVDLPKHGMDQPIAFTGARLITLSNDESVQGVIPFGTIVLNGQRIAEIGSVGDVVIPSDALVINVAGHTIIPGLIDTHYHRIGGGGLSAFALPNRRFSDRTAIGYGITTAWEPGGAANDGVPAMVDMQQAGRILGPRWSYSAEGAVGYPWRQLTTYRAALAAVNQHKKLGVSILKEYNTPSRLQRQWLSVAAHEAGLGIVSHLQTFDGMITRVVDGYTGGDHPYIPVPFYRDVQELLRRTGYIWTPNIVITGGSIGTVQDVKSYYWRKVIDKFPAELGKLRTMTSAEYAARMIDAVPTVFEEFHRVGRVAKQAAIAATNGVHIGVSAHNMPGANLHRELWYLWKGGLPIIQVLRAATIGNAEKLGLQEEIGSLEPGKIADFLVLEKNPLDDILNTLSLKYTVQGGTVYNSATAQRVNLASIQGTNISEVH